MSRSKVRQIVVLTVKMNKSGPQTYPNEDKESLVVASTNTEVGHGLFLDCHGVLQKFQNAIKAVKYRCGDCDIQEESSLRYFCEVIKCVNKKGDEHKSQTKILVQVQ